MISTTDDDYTMENKFGVIRTRINSNFNLLRIMNKEDDQAASIIGDNGKYTLEKLVGKPNKKQLQQVFFIEGKLEDFFPMKTELSLN